MADTNIITKKIKTGKVKGSFGNLVPSVPTTTFSHPKDKLDKLKLSQIEIDTPLDFNGNVDALILDADGDTTISAPTDDQIDIEIAGADDFTFTANTLTALSGSSIATDTISETTSGSGVTIDSVKLKDGAGFIQFPREVVTAANIMSASEVGKVFFLNSATGFAHTLPAPAAGLHYKFIVTTIPTSGNCTIGTASAANIIEGMANVDSTLVLASNEDSINFIASTCLIGDWVEVLSDGTSWFVNGQSGAAGGITFTS